MGCHTSQRPSDMEPQLQLLGQAENKDDSFLLSLFLCLLLGCFLSFLSVAETTSLKIPSASFCGYFYFVDRCRDVSR